MKHPALARVMAVTLAIMCVIMLITGVLGFGKAESKYAEDTADYEKLTDRITTYNELTEKLADAESYKQVSAALDEHQQQHDDDHRAAEHNVQQAALAAAQQTDLVVVLKPNLAHKRTSFVQSLRCGSAARGVFLL